METIFMNTGNSNTNEPHRFRLTLPDKLNLKVPNKNIALDNLSIYYTWKCNKKSKSAYNKRKLKLQLQVGMINLICLMDHTLFHTFKIILCTLLKIMKL